MKTGPLPVQTQILRSELMNVFSHQSPGQYYFKPMMKEFRFEPASQMITVEEGQTLSIDITGIKTAYRYDKAFYTLRKKCIYN